MHHTRQHVDMGPERTAAMKSDGPAAHAPLGQSLVRGGREASSVSVPSTETGGWMRDNPSHWNEY